MVKETEHICKNQETLKYLRDSNILLQDALNIKEKHNGERDKQIQEAQIRIQQHSKEATQQVETLRDIVTQTRELLMQQIGYQQQNKETTKKYINLIGLIIAALTTIITALTILIHT